MTIEKDETMEAAKKVFLHYCDCVMNAVRNDFGANPNPGARDDALEWFVESVDTLRLAGIDCVIDNPAFFKEPEIDQRPVH